MKAKSKIEKSSCTSWQRIVASVVTFVFTIQLCMPAIAGATSILESSLIEAELNTNYLFQRESSSDYQFKSADYLDTNAHQQDVNIETFFERLKQTSKENLPPPIMIPIGVGDITVILPHYPLTKRVGTNFVQSRYIRSQVYAQLGRNLINTQVYGAEQEQISKLYDNAYNYALASGKLFGTSLGLTAAQIPSDMVWPEIRYINGEDVLVPILYLKSSTITAQKVTGDENEFGGNSITLAGLQIDNSDVTFRRNAFLQVAGNLINNQGNLIAEGDLQIIAGGALRNISGIISSEGDLVIGAHSIENRTIVHRYDLGTLQSERFGPIAEINAQGDIFFKTSSDIILLGSVVSAGETIRFEAGGDIYIGSQQITNQAEGSSGSISYQRSTVSHLASKVSASDTIAMIAQGNILIDASEIVSDNGHIELLAGLGITVEDNLDVTQSYRKGKYGKRKIEESVYQTVAIRSILDAGKGIRLHSNFGDITLRAVDITSHEGTEVKATGGGINLLMTTETDHYSYSSIKKGLFTVSTENRGHVIETGVTNSIVGGLAVEALSGVNVEYEGDSSLTMDQQISKLAQMEGLEWMADVRTNTPDVDWTAIELKYEEWNESRTSISPAFAAVISVAMAIATSGASAGWFEAAISAGLASLESQLVISLANGIVNGDIPGAMEDLASTETLKSIGVAMVTAGAVKAIDVKFFGADTNAIAEGKAASEAVLAIDPTNIVGADQAFQLAFDAAIQESTLTIAQQSAQAVTHAAVRAGLESAVYDLDFKDSFVQSLAQQGIDILGQHMAEKIGAAFDHNPQGSPNPLDTALKYIFHAGAGCAIGVATAENSGEQNSSDGCATGAFGAVVGEFVGSVYEERTQSEVEEATVAMEQLLIDFEGDIDQLVQRGYSNLQIKELLRADYGLGALEERVDHLKQQGVNLARFSAALGAFAAGAEASGINIAADTGANAAENNALFLIALAPLLLKAIDAAIIGYDLYQIYKVYEEQGEEAGEAALANYLLESAGAKLLESLFPGGKIAGKIYSKIEHNELVQAIRQLGANSADSFLNLIQANTGSLGDSVVKYVNRRKLKDSPDITYNGGHVPTQHKILKVSDKYSFDGDIIIGPNNGRYRDSGVLYNGRPVLERADGNGGYFVLDENGLQHPISSPFSSTIVERRIYHEEKVNDIVDSIGDSDGLIVQKEVSIQYDNLGHPDHGTLARADLSITGGMPGKTIDIPEGFELYDLDGNRVTGGIQLDTNGQAILEVKTGNATLTGNQKTVYSACQLGQASACGNNATFAEFKDEIVPTSVYVLRPTEG
ncbi:DUF637 domain-containing protein [Microbulbifer sp. TYP-18]|uniref:DUF637 domain-containing protein n=1 Tax=Microbulbifer sp. TYP-18 TaxID=3230024 RepID=UPI0034C61AE0